jgi:hypothetical protein
MADLSGTNTTPTAPQSQPQDPQTQTSADSTQGVVQQPSIPAGAPGGVNPSAQPPVPAGTQLNPSAIIPGQAEPKSSILQSVFQTIAGGKKTSWVQTPDGPKQQTENLAPGTISRNILAAALTGLAGGYGVQGGPGAGKARAISAGFNAETENLDKQKQLKQQQAQTQFKNQQEADELTLRKAADHRDQLRSMELMQEHEIGMRREQQQLDAGQFDLVARGADRQLAQAARWDLLKEAGVTPLLQNGKPIPEFKTEQEASDFANKNANLVIQPGKYNTTIEYNPDTLSWSVMQKPITWDTPQYLGMKIDPKTRLPLKDKDGNYEPDGTFKDVNGKSVAPASMMTQRDFFNSQVANTKAQGESALTKENIAEIRARTMALRIANKKDLDETQAGKEWNAAGGDVNAVDAKGNFIVSPTSRIYIEKKIAADAATESKNLETFTKQISALDPKDPEYAGLKDDIDNTRSVLRQLQVNQKLLTSKPDLAGSISKDLRDQFTSDNGTYDEKAAQAAADKIQAPSAVKQQIRQKLSSEVPNLPPAKLEQIAQGVIAKYPPDQQVAFINSAPGLSKSDKTTLLSRINSPAAKSAVAANDLSSVSPDSTLVKGPNGSREIPNEAVAEFLKNHADYTEVGKGTKSDNSEQTGSNVSGTGVPGSIGGQPGAATPAP